MTSERVRRERIELGAQRRLVGGIGPDVAPHAEGKAVVVKRHVATRGPVHEHQLRASFL